MRAFAPTQSQSQKPTSSGFASSEKNTKRQDADERLRGRAQRATAGHAPPPHFGHAFSRVPTQPAPPLIQNKLAVNRPGDEYELEADRVARHVMLAPGPRAKGACGCAGVCSKCQAGANGEGLRRLQTKRVGAAAPSRSEAPSIVHEVLAAPG